MRVNNLSNLDEINSYRYRNLDAHLIVDTNVLLLLLIGIYDPAYIKECPLMTQSDKIYEEEHFELIKEILKCFLYKVVITPHVLSEVNMLSRTRIKPSSRVNPYFLKLIKELGQWREENAELKILLKNGAILEFGFTDMSLVEVAKKNKWVILTDEFQLYNNFNNTVPIISFSAVAANEKLKVKV